MLENFEIRILRYTNLVIPRISRTNYYKIKDHYVLTHTKSDKTYINVFTKKPFGTYHKISETGINPKFKTPQYLQNQTYIVNTETVKLDKAPEAEIYLEAHKKIFKNVLAQIDHNKAIDLTTYAINAVITENGI